MALFVGTMPRDTPEKELEDFFLQFGKLKRCEIKPSRHNRKTRVLKHVFVAVLLTFILSLVAVCLRHV